MDYNTCDTCPLRLYNKDDKLCIKGYGNIHYKHFIILPYVDTIAYKEYNLSFGQIAKDLDKAFISSTGELSNKTHYITSLIKCKETNKINIDNQILNRCMCYLNDEIIRFKPKIILLLGNVVNKMLNITIEEGLGKIYVHNGICYFINYNPSIGRYSSDKLEVFKKELDKYINAITSNNFSNYEILKI